jgi:hypothetical protein
MVYQHLPTPRNTPGGVRARPARTRPGRHHSAEEAPGSSATDGQRVQSGAIARIAGRFIRAFRTRG